MGKCRVCKNKAKWNLRGKHEPIRSYCGLEHLAKEVNEALNNPYFTPDLGGKNVPFWRGKSG